jgi:hypothetical protein
MYENWPSGSDNGLLPCDCRLVAGLTSVEGGVDVEVVSVGQRSAHALVHRAVR